MLKKHDWTILKVNERDTTWRCSRCMGRRHDVNVPGDFAPIRLSDGWSYYRISNENSGDTLTCEEYLFASVMAT